MFVIIFLLFHLKASLYFSFGQIKIERIPSILSSSLSSFICQSRFSFFLPFSLNALLSFSTGCCLLHRQVNSLYTTARQRVVWSWSQPRRDAPLYPHLERCGRNGFTDACVLLSTPRMLARNSRRVSFEIERKRNRYRDTERERDREREREKESITDRYLHLSR